MRPLIIIALLLLASCRPTLPTYRPDPYLSDTSIPPDEKELLIKGERDLKKMDSIIHRRNKY